jgi:peptidoglycan/xylan/chitin deacetylase (PgdA/CDA1 family)
MDDFELPMCHLLNASVCEDMPQIPARIRQRGDEVVGHGYTNSERQSDMDEATEAEMIAHATRTLADSCGERPYGWMGPWISETAVTPDLLQENGYTFLMDWPADDQPFWMKTRAGRIMSLPYPIEINDTPTMLSRAQPATDFHRMILDQFEEMLRLSADQSLVFGISLHTLCTGQPFRLAQVRQALELITAHRSFEKLWVTTPGKIAQYAATLPAGCVP